MNQLIIVFCLFVILIEIFLIKGQSSENYEQYELRTMIMTKNYS